MKPDLSVLPPQARQSPKLLDQVAASTQNVALSALLLPLLECLALRIKDVDFHMHQITVRDGKGEKDRVTMLPDSLVEPLKQQIQKATAIHDQDLVHGHGAVYLPYALERKYSNANKELGWQYVFPADQMSVDPRDGVIRRHHIREQSSFSLSGLSLRR
jgi:integrase